MWYYNMKSPRQEGWRCLLIVVLKLYLSCRQKVVLHTSKREHVLVVFELDYFALSVSFCAFVCCAITRTLVRFWWNLLGHFLYELSCCLVFCSTRNFWKSFVCLVRPTVHRTIKACPHIADGRPSMWIYC
jgi:hypothetical protein